MRCSIWQGKSDANLEKLRLSFSLELPSGLIDELTGLWKSGQLQMVPSEVSQSSLGMGTATEQLQGCFCKDGILAGEAQVFLGEFSL